MTFQTRNPNPGDSTESEIVVHIGHNKTGSSAIQTLLSRNRNRLAEFGVEYPHQASLDAAARGEVSAGNPEAFKSFSGNASGRVLFSSETFLNRVDTKRNFVDVLNDLPGKKKIICFTRDLVAHFASTYGQYIKRKAGTDTSRSFVSQYEVFAKLERTIRAANNAGHEMVLANYSRHNSDLEVLFMELILGEKAAEFLQGANRFEGVVNRSLTSGELEFQRQFNRHSDHKTSGYISDVLVNALPAIEADRITIDHQTYDALVEKTRTPISFINEHLPVDEQINVEATDQVREADDAKRLYFNRDQIDVLVASIAEQMKSRSIRQTEIQALRDVAVKIEAAAPELRPAAIELMRIAQRLRPEGKFISKKLKEWER